MAQAAIPARGSPTLHLGWFGAAALVVIVALVAGGLGYLASENRWNPVDPDHALVNDSTAVWGAPYDEAKVAAIYAQDAVIHDTIAGGTTSGLPAIKALIAGYIKDMDFKVWPVGDSVRSGDYVATFVDYGTATTAADQRAHALTLMQVKDGKVQNQWLYPVE